MAYAVSDRMLVEEVKRNSLALGGASDGFDAIVEDLAQSRIVMLGESTHGTEDFYELRRRISSRLISEYGFNFVAVEGDWPACWRVNEYANGMRETGLRQAFGAFHRWPTWMWANTSVVKFAEWLHSRNARYENLRDRAGFYGLDVYSLFESVDAVLKALRHVSPEFVPKAKELYSCLKGYGQNEKAYARSLVEFPEGCEAQVAEVLSSLLQIRFEAESQRGSQSDWKENDVRRLHELFNIEQNARAVKDADLYYRTMIHGSEDSWNVRDRHMLDTLTSLMEHYESGHGHKAKGIVWAHNQHVGDYRGCDMEEGGLVSLGGLAREKWGSDAVSLVGFGTYKGQTLASSAWGGEVQKMKIPEAREDSYERILHIASMELGEESLYLPMRGLSHSPLLQERRPQRSIGVVYYPKYEHFGNYVDTTLGQRYDSFIHLDVTGPLATLDQKIERKDMPEAWPSGT